MNRSNLAKLIAAFVKVRPRLEAVAQARTGSRAIAEDLVQDAWIKRADTEAKVNGRAMLDEFLGYVREFEKSSTYVPGFQRFVEKCGKK